MHDVTMHPFTLNFLIVSIIHRSHLITLNHTQVTLASDSDLKGTVVSLTAGTYSAAAKTYSYIGCYLDKQSTSFRGLPNKLATSAAMTVQVCGALAQSAGYSLFGLQYYQGEITGDNS